MQIIPLQAVPSQSVEVLLDGQQCEVQLQQRATGLFMDLSVAGELVVAGVICQNLNRIVRSLYLGLSGDFCFVDGQGSDDPIYTGLGDKFQLAYIPASELPDGEG